MALYYGPAAPADMLAQFDRVVVEADHLAPAQLAALTRAHTQVFAYISVGEVDRTRSFYPAIDRGWVLGQNPSFQSDILDQTKDGWRAFLIDKWMKPLWDRGFRGFFLDTLDSYQQVVTADDGRKAQVQAMAETLRQVSRRFPGVKLIWNRGFELLPQVGGLACGLAAESLFRGYSAGTYTEVPEADRRWLVDRLTEARDRYHLPVTAIDYVAPGDRELMRTTARRVAALGFTPYVTGAGLDSLGVGAVEVVPRRILAVWSSDEQNDPSEVKDVAYTEVHRIGAMPLEYLGYAVDYVDVKGPLPEYSLAGRYAGVVTWFTQDLKSPGAYQSFLERQLRDGVKVAVLGNLGFELSPEWQERLSLRVPEVHPRGKIKVRLSDKLVGFEAPVHPLMSGFSPLVAAGDKDGMTVHLSLTDGDKNVMDAVLIAPWGGLALDPYVLEDGYKGGQRWVLDPFEFYRQALALLPMPMADVTTENGHRLLITHIDGDGFVSRAEMRKEDFSGKVILDQILKVYNLPTTVSVIEGEVGEKGKYPDLSPELEAIARDIFRLPNVEVASHSFSHPFDWQRLGRDQSDGDINGLFRYDFSLSREIKGSVDYINQRLAPPDKPVKVFLWSGNAVPMQDAVAMTRELGLINLNGGDTTASRSNPSLTNVSPMGRPFQGEDGDYHIYAPVQNENIYTNLWRGPFYGFRDVISTFQITGSPRRIKPMNIYYHFYSGSKIGSLKALRSVYDWALLQDPLPVYVSEYAKKVTDFQHLTLGRRLDGGWQVRGQGNLRTLRLPPELGWPDLSRSIGVKGVSDQPQGRYVSLQGTGNEVLYLTQNPPAAAVPSGGAGEAVAPAAPVKKKPKLPQPAHHAHR
jgi:hypothetical protein